MEKWVNLNSFAARLLGMNLPQWDNYAIWQLRSTLEEPSQRKEILNCEVSAAAQWMLQGGADLFKRLDGDLSDEETRMTKPGSLYDGRAGLCRERWDFWKKRFADVGEQVDSDPGQEANAAAQRMSEIEKS